MDKITWEIGSIKAASGEPVEYIPLARNSSDSNEAEKEHNRQWNLMVNALRDNHLMKEKGE
ncbi:hypothetical protein D3C71_1035440 [compost metagenome]